MFIHEFPDWFMNWVDLGWPECQALRNSLVFVYLLYPKFQHFPSLICVHNSLHDLIQGVHADEDEKGVNFTWCSASGSWFNLFCKWCFIVSSFVCSSFSLNMIDWSDSISLYATSLLNSLNNLVTIFDMYFIYGRMIHFHTCPHALTWTNVCHNN